jgi:hypothetical protein
LFETVVDSGIHYPDGYDASNGKRVALKVVGQALAPALHARVLNGVDRFKSVFKHGLRF